MKYLIKFGPDILIVIGLFMFVSGIFNFRVLNRPDASYWYESSTQQQIAFGASIIALGFLSRKHLRS